MTLAKPANAPQPATPDCEGMRLAASLIDGLLSLDPVAPVIARATARPQLPRSPQGEGNRSEDARPEGRA